MSGASELLLRIVGLALITAIGLAGAWAWRDRERWGFAPAPLTRRGGLGPYREARLHRSVARGAPVRVTLVAALGAAWGITTSLVLGPLGFLFLFSPARHDPHRQILLTTSGLGAFATALSALALGACLVLVSRALVRRDADLEERALCVSVWSTIHHLLVLGSFALFSLHESDARMLALVSIPCALGLFHAWALARVARWTSRFETEASA